MSVHNSLQMMGSVTNVYKHKPERDRAASDSSSPLSLLQSALASLIAISVKEEQAIYGMENEQAIYGMEEGMMEPVRHNM